MKAAEKAESVGCNTVTTVRTGTADVILRLAMVALFTVGSEASTISAADWPQWRGPNRDGVSRESGLLPAWPKEGPRLLWQIKDLGTGFSTPAIAGGRLYVLSNKGLEDEFVQSRDVKDGRLVWSTRIGKVGNPNQQPPYPGARSTPTVDGEFLYALGSDGDLACLELATGRVRWQKSLRADFAGKPGQWAYSESPLIDGQAIVCTPGGAEATLVALNKATGAVLWKCGLPEADEAAYSSAITLETAGIRQYVQLLQKGLVGVAANSGKFLWRDDRPVSIFNANIPTPVAGGDFVYVASAGTGGGAVKLNVKGPAIVPEPVYFNAKMPTAIGGAVKVGDFLYGTTAQAMMCFELKSGQAKWQERALGAASLCFADGHLYLHGENGEVALVEASPESYREKGRFTPPEQPQRGMAMAWAYPAVADGRLYIRDLDCLWCYDIRQGGKVP